MQNIRHQSDRMHTLTLFVTPHIKNIFWAHCTLYIVCRCTASAQSSLPGSTVERRASPSGSRSTRLPWETVESTQNISTLPPAKLKSLRYTLNLSWGEMLTFLTTSCVNTIKHVLFYCLIFDFSQRGRTASKRLTGRRWRNAPLKRRKSTNLPTIPLSYQRSVCCCSGLYEALTHPGCLFIWTQVQNVFLQRCSWCKGRPKHFSILPFFIPVFWLRVVFVCWSPTD